MELVIPAFIAGILTFLAPCTLPLVPGFIAFIGGASFSEPENKITKRKIFINSVFYCIGFSAVFIILGSLFGLSGAFLIKYRAWLSRVGGALIIIFGLYLFKAFNMPFFNIKIEGMNFLKKLKPGEPTSSFAFGAIFALGWSPCIGPILGSVLLLASSEATLAKGAFLLFIFSLGLSIPFLIMALALDFARKSVKKISGYLNVISKIGGALLIIMGVLILTNNFAKWIGFFYNIFRFINYEKILNYL